MLWKLNYIYIAVPLHTSPLSYPHHILGTRILSYSGRFVSMFSLPLDFILSFVSMFSPALDHDSCVMFYQAGLFLLIPR